MIDFNWTEIFALAVLAVILFGPEKLPEFAKKAARVVAYLRKVGDDARGQLRAELGPEFDDFHLTDLNPRNFVARHVLSAEDKDDLLSIRDELKGVGQVASTGLTDVKDGIEGLNAAGTDEAPVSTLVAYAPAPPFDPEAT